MKQLLHLSAAALITVGLTFTSCRHKDADPDMTSLTEQANDDQMASGSLEDATYDVDQLFNATSLAGGRTAFNVCGASVDSSVAGIRTITFDGTTSCGPRGVIRSGSITAQLFNTAHWRDAGAVLLITFNDYKVTRANGKTATFSGSGKITNVSGGLRKELGHGRTEPVVHRVRFNGVKMTFNNHNFSDWHTAKTRTFSVTGNDLYNVQVTGDTTLNAVANIGAWGTGRRGQSVYVQFEQPMQANSSCGFDAPTAGIKLHKGLVRELTTTFGVDQSGDQITTGCAYGYKYEFVGPRRTETGVVSY